MKSNGSKKYDTKNENKSIILEKILEKINDLNQEEYLIGDLFGEE